MVVGALMVHAGDHGLDHLAVRKAQHADLRPGEELFHHHMVAGCAELFVQHDLLDAIGGLLLVLTDQHALAQCKAVCLDDHRVLALGADVIHDLCGVIEGLVLCGGDAVFLHQILGEHLGGLDAGSGLVRAKGGDGVIADAAVARCAPDLAAVGALFQCLDDGVLAAAAAHY